jgi:hypothetical protein
MIDDLRGHLFLFFWILFFRQRVNIAFQGALASTMERKIALVGDACYKALITIRSHDLHDGDIRKIMDAMVSHHKRD